MENCTIITTEANAALAKIHGRMPVMLDPEAFGDWLDNERPAGELQAMLRPYPEASVIARPVSTRANKVANDDAGCLEADPV